MMDDALQRCIEEAVSFRLGDGRRLRVARTLLTCAAAASVLNRLHVPAESDSAYRHVNVHNPRCPLRFDPDTGLWRCAPELDEHPVWGINWAGALWICQQLGARLPLAHEWEAFASNNDPLRPYPWGDAAPNHLLANYDEYVGGTSPVGSFPASELGFYDLAGNLSEWCHDHYQVPGVQGLPCERVVKGGAWSKGADQLRITATRGKWQRLGTTTIGIRPVWDD